MNNMRRGFTMIELIFVIVIIGILAAVAIPKLAATRDDATAATCIHEAGQLIQEVSAQYTAKGNADFITSNVSTMTNIVIDTNRGIAADGLVHGNDIDYNCDGATILTLNGANELPDYNLSITVTDGTTPASKIASDALLTSLGATSGTAIKKTL